VPKLENSEDQFHDIAMEFINKEQADVDQLHDIAMEFIKEEQAAEEWKNLPLIDAPLDCNLDVEHISGDVPGKLLCLLGCI
jgi:methionine aminopeptidase